MSEELKNVDLDQEPIEQGNEGFESEQEQEEQKIPLKKFLEEKSRRKELEKRFKELEIQHLSSKQKEQALDIEEYIKQEGYDETFAKVQSKVFNKIMDLVPKPNHEDDFIKEEIEDLAETEPSILKYKKQIIERIKKFKKVGEDLSVEEAYSHLKPSSKIRESELKTHVEQVNAVARRNAENKKQIASTPSSPKDSYPLDDNDKKALEGLKKMQPDNGWNEEKYYKSRYSKT
jgi:hypothetical protein